MLLQRVTPPGLRRALVIADYFHAGAQQAVLDHDRIVGHRRPRLGGDRCVHRHLPVIVWRNATVLPFTSAAGARPGGFFGASTVNGTEIVRPGPGGRWSSVRKLWVKASAMIGCRPVFFRLRVMSTSEPDSS